MKKRRRWWILAVVVVVIAAAVAGGALWFGRSKTPTVRYLTATAATGTISNTVQADFTLAAAQGTTTIALGGSSTNGSSSGTSASSTTISSTLPNTTTGATATFVVFASTSSPTPSPSPSSTPTSTPMPTPTPTSTPTKSPSPSPRPTSSGSGSGGIGASTGSGGSRSSASTSGSSSSRSSSSSTSSAASGIVTRLALPVGATPHTLQRLLTVSGKPVFAFVSATPLYKTLSVDLSSGSQVANVMALQRALKSRGYYTGSVNGTFGSSTQTALKKWQGDQGVRKTGKITTSRFVWVPRGRILYSWRVALGSQVSSGTALATVGAPRDLVAQALVSQADIASLKVGQKATLTIDGATGDPFTGTISFIDTQPASSSSTGGTSSTVQYTVDFVPHGLPALARSGMTGTLEIILAQRKNVLIVPTRAVSGTSASTYVRVMNNGKPMFRQVSTGMATSTFTEITSGLTAGEVVITGVYSNAAASTTFSGPSGLGGFPSGTGRPNGSTGGFPAPPGAGQ